MPDFLQQLQAELDDWEREGLRRQRRVARVLPGGRVEVAGRTLLNLCSNDYLGLASELDLAALAREPGLAAGATASPLIVGYHPATAALEEQMAALKGTAAALVFGSGYLANVGTLAALVGRDDAVYSDRLNHASIVDGIVLARAEHHRYRHRDLDHLETLLRAGGRYRRRLIVTDAIFSMDGDLAPLAELVALKEKYGALLMVDEAHSGGVCGPQGAGLVAALGLSARVDVQMGTFSKAYGVYGAYVAGARVLVDYLVNRARSLVYSTALPPLVVRAIQDGVARAARDEWRRERLREHAAAWRAGLQRLGLDTGGSECQIVPALVGSSERALAFSRALAAAGVAAWAIRPPTVPAGTARVRFSLTAALSAADREAALTQVAAAVSALGPA